MIYPSKYFFWMDKKSAYPCGMSIPYYIDHEEKTIIVKSSKTGKEMMFVEQHSVSSKDDFKSFRGYMPYEHIKLYILYPNHPDYTFFKKKIYENLSK